MRHFRNYYYHYHYCEKTAVIKVNVKVRGFIQHPRWQVSRPQGAQTWITQFNHRFSHSLGGCHLHSMEELCERCFQMVFEVVISGMSLVLRWAVVDCRHHVHRRMYLLKSGYKYVNPSIATLKLQNNTPSYSNTVTGTLAIDGWPVTFGTVRRGLAPARPGPSSLYQM